MRALGRNLACLIGLALVFGCQSDSPSPTAPSASVIPGGVNDSRLTRGVHNGLAICQIPHSTTGRAVIGPAGGTLRVGPHTLVVPAGALSRNVTITGLAPVAPFVVVNFQPEGLQFAVPARLTMYYGSCPASLVHPVIVYTSANLKHVERLPSTANDVTRFVSAPIHHFSSYMVAH